MSRLPLVRAVAVAVVALTCATAAPAVAAPARSFDLQAHRGGLGLRVESTLSSFGNAIRLGVTTLELDVQITRDGQAVVTHDRKVDGRKCRDTAPANPGDPAYPYIGKFVHTLTLAQVRTLDCGSLRQDNFPGQVLTPGATMPLLREVFDLVRRYRADEVRFNVETKVEAGAPSETAPREQFVQVTAREIAASGMADRVTVQSFDWGALMRMREVAPRVPLVALTNYDFLQVGQPGASPWLGGIDIDSFGGDPIAAVRSFGAAAFSPVHGFPQGGTVNDPGYRPYVTRAMVDHAHRNGLKIVPWTVDDTATMAKLMSDGVDGIITDYPDRLRALMAERGYRLPRAYGSPFDVQGHRGARALRPENTLAGFRYALSRDGVSTLELDTGVTADGVVVVLHDRAVNGSHCVDTGPVRPGDPMFPYVGKLVRDLTLAQIKTLDCGSRTLPEFPRQVAVPGERIPTLREVFAVAAGRPDIRFNIETKISPLVSDTVPYQEFTWKVVTEIVRAGMVGRATLQSFDWRTIMLARRIAPRLATVALIWQYGPAECASLADECSLRAVYGDSGVKSPWTGGLDWWKYRDVGELVRRAGASTVSANWQVHDPSQPVAPNDDWYLRQDPAYFHGPAVDGLRGLRVVPYTVNDAGVLERVMSLGVDGVISDDPELVVAVAARFGLR